MKKIILFIEKIERFIEKIKEMLYKVIGYILNFSMTSFGIYGIIQMNFYGADYEAPIFPYILLATGLYSIWYNYIYKGNPERNK